MLTVWETQKNLKFCQSFAKVITWDAQAFSLQTPTTHTTENSKWDIIEEKEKINSEERPQ